MQHVNARLAERISNIRHKVGVSDLDCPMNLNQCLIGDLADPTFRESNDLQSTGLAVEAWAAGQNYVVIDRTGKNDLRNLRVRCHRPDSIIYVGKNCTVKGLIRVHAQGGVCVLEGDNGQPTFFNVTLWSRDNTVIIGRQTTSNGTHLVTMGQGASITIGNDCMFSTGVWLKTSDMHCIVDVVTQEVLNKDGNVGHIVLGKHVWVGQDALVVLGVRIGDGAIIGAKSYVNQDIEKLTLNVGTPVRQLRSGVTWLRSHVFVPTEFAAVREHLGLVSRS
jgi:carbonic anhydrase/acetyltransferase-like protein (isoleucine patch superfamily)